MLKNITAEVGLEIRKFSREFFYKVEYIMVLISWLLRVIICEKVQIGNGSGKGAI